MGVRSRMRSAVVRIGVRRLSRIATAGLAVCLVSLTVVILGGAIESRRTGDRARHEVELSGAYGEVQSAVLMVARAQRSAPEASTATAAAATQVADERARADLGRAIQQVRDLGGAQDHALASYIAIEARRFDAKAGTAQRTTHAVDTLETLVTEASDTHRGNAARAMTALAGQQRAQITAAVVLLTASSVCLAACWLLLLVLQRDLRRQAALHRHRADHDELTGLPNRGAFHTALDEAVTQPWWEARTSVLLIDLDRFKPVNDIWGHGIGDEVLIAVAGRLLEELQDGDVAGRLGGDEFALVLTGRGERDGAAQAASLRRRLAEPYETTAGTVRISASIGCASAPMDGLAASDLLRRADGAMYWEKSQARRAARTDSVAEAFPFAAFS